MSETFTLYKLIVLYMLSKVDFPMTNSQISEFILGQGYTNYFTLQQAISEMVDSNLLTEEDTHNRTLYHLTESGAETLSYFKNKISAPILDDIHRFLKDKKYDLKNEVSVKADYYRNTNKEFTVHCSVIEDNANLIDLTLNVPTEIEAETMVNNWNRRNQEIYAFIVSKLL